MKTLMLLLGNGLTIDLIKHLKKDDFIDTQHLFCKGNLVPWPDGQNEIGFLSYKHCRNLWNVGARPYMSRDEANALIEDIISCANMVTDKLRSSSGNIFMDAYYELAAYLKHLFIYYDKMVSNDALKDSKITEQWGYYQLLKKAYESSDYSKIIVVTYNYDIFLERILMANGIPFDIGCAEDNKSKICILKPHGSISFCHKKQQEKETYKIRNSPDMNEACIDDFIVSYESLDNNYLVSALIPPSGDSSRLTYKWAQELREEVKQQVAALQPADKLVISGLSYWHVDRKEIDDVLTTVNNKVNTFLVNPNPPRALNAVLSCIFENYILYTDSSVLGGII